MVFKDVMGRWITAGLFKETAQSKEYIQYTLEEAKDLYIACNDPTGYLFATTHLGGYKHFIAIKNSSGLEAHVFLWEEELEIKMRSEALARVFDYAKTDKGYQAAKYLVEAGWKKKGKGRPSKAEQDREKRLRADTYKEFEGQGHLRKV